MLKAKTTRKVYDNSGNEWDVHGWYLLKNGWEYWQLEPVDANGDMFGYVMGFAHEFGTFNIHEIEPHVVSATEGGGLWDLAPPSDSDWIGWTWSENDICRAPAGALQISLWEFFGGTITLENGHQYQVTGE